MMNWVPSYWIQRFDSARASRSSHARVALPLAKWLTHPQICSILYYSAFKAKENFVPSHDDKKKTCVMAEFRTHRFWMRDVDEWVMNLGLLENKRCPCVLCLLSSLVTLINSREAMQIICLVLFQASVQTSFQVTWQHSQTTILLLTG